MKKNKFISYMLAMTGIILVGMGVAFNASAALGNDSVGIMYDGIRNAAKLSPRQLGTASNFVNIGLLIIVFLLNPHYVNIGTFIYIIPYGIIVDIGGKLYRALFQIQSLPIQIMGAVLGCFLLYMGVAMYLVADIGLDPINGLVMVLKDKTGKEYRTVKICFDISCIVLGFFLGGRIGVITLVTAFVAGPVIQFMADIMRSIHNRDKNIHRFFTS